MKYQLIKTKMLITALWLLPLNLIVSQTTNKKISLDTSSTLAVVPFKEAFENNDDETDYSKIIAERVLTAVEQSRRFNLIDRTDFETIAKEMRLWEGEHKDDFSKYNDDALMRYGQRLKADFILTGTIFSVEAPLSPITGSYKATLGFSIKVISVRSNKIYVTESFEVSSGSIRKIYNSPKEAILAAISNAGEPIKLFVDKYFPVYAKYLRSEKVNPKNNEIKEVLINKGTEMGLRLGQKLDIVIEDTSGKNLPPEDIGDAEIIKIQPDHAVVKILSAKKPLESLENKDQILYFRSKSN
jgi:TolB-like protein